MSATMASGIGSRPTTEVRELRTHRVEGMFEPNGTSTLANVRGQGFTVEPKGDGQFEIVLGKAVDGLLVNFGCSVAYVNGYGVAPVHAEFIKLLGSDGLSFTLQVSQLGADEQNQEDPAVSHAQALVTDTTTTPGMTWVSFFLVWALDGEAVLPA